MGVAMKRILSILASLALLASLASDGLAQRGVGVRARQNTGAEKRVALVIGNANYGRSMGRLINPANDAANRERRWTRRQIPGGHLPLGDDLHSLQGRRQPQ